MTCSEIEHRLDDFVDGTLSEGEFQEVELHLQSCPACREEERLLRAVLTHAAALSRESAPRSDLWPGIRDRIAWGERGDGVSRRLRRPRSLWVPALAAAVVLVALSSMIRPQMETIATPQGRKTLVSTPAGPPLLEAEIDYVRATNELLEALNARPSSLSPETVKIVDENIRIIDEALRSVHDALKSDPSNPDLTHFLTSTHKKKLELLTRVTKLSRKV